MRTHAAGMQADRVGRLVLTRSFRLFFAELDQMTGVAAILRFPMPEIDEEFHDLDSDDND